MISSLISYGIITCLLIIRGGELLKSTGSRVPQEHFLIASMRVQLAGRERDRFEVGESTIDDQNRVFRVYRLSHTWVAGHISANAPPDTHA